MSGFASFASSQARFARSPSSTTSQPLRTSPLKESYIPRGSSTASSSRSSSPHVHADTDTAEYTDGEASGSASSSSFSSTESSDVEDDLVFFGTPTAKDVDAIARLSSAIPGTPGTPGTPFLASPMSIFTPSKRVKRVKKRDSREFLRRQTILTQPIIGDTPVRSSSLKGKGKESTSSIVPGQGEERGQKEVKVWPGGFFERLSVGAREEDTESDYAPTPLRIAGGTPVSRRRVTLSPTSRHDDCELTFDFRRLGLSTPMSSDATSSAQQQRLYRSRRSDSLSTIGSSSSRAEQEETAEMDFSADEELADSDKENHPAPTDEQNIGDTSEDADMMARELFEGPLSGEALVFVEDVSVEARELDMGGLKLEDYGDEDVGGGLESDDGGLSDSSTDSAPKSPAQRSASPSLADDAASTSTEDGKEPVTEQETQFTDAFEEETNPVTEEEERSATAVEEGINAVTEEEEQSAHAKKQPINETRLSPPTPPPKTPALAASPVSSPSSSFIDSPLPLSRAPVKIPIVPHFSPLRHDSPSLDDICPDVAHPPAHLISPSVPALSRRMLSTPERSPSCSTRPIRAPLPLSTPTPQIHTSASVRQSGAADVASPARLAVSTVARTVPASMQKARQAAKSRELSPGAKLQRSQKIKDQLASAIDASAAAPPRQIPAHPEMGSQSAASTGSASARGRLGMGPPARPGSACSSSSSGSSGTRPMPKPAVASSRITPAAQGGTSASSRSAVSRMIPAVKRTVPAGSELTRIGTGSAKPISSSSSSASSSISQRPLGSRPGITKPTITTTSRTTLAASAKAGPLPRSALAPRDLTRAPSTATSAKSTSSAAAALKASTAAPKSTRPVPLSANTGLNSIPATSARSSPAKMTGLKRSRSEMTAVPQAVAAAVGVETSSSRMLGRAERPEMRAFGPAKRVVGANVYAAPVASRALPPPSSAEVGFAPTPEQVHVPDRFAEVYAGPTHFQMGVAPAVVNTPRSMGRAHKMGSVSRAGESARMNKVFHFGTPSRMGGTSTSSHGFRSMGQTSLKSAFEAVALAKSASEPMPTGPAGPQHFDSTPTDSDAPPAASTRSHPGSSDTDRVPSSSPATQARGSSEDHAEVSFMIPNAASSSEPGSSPIKRSGNRPSPPLAVSNDPPSSPPTTRSASESPQKPPKAKRAIPGGAASRAKPTAPKLAPTAAKTQTQAPKSIVPNMTEKELKTKTAFNTAKNEKRQCAIDRKVIHIDLPRPPSPTSKIPTTAAREEREKKMGREERARRRKQDEEDAKADLGEMLVQREERAMAPGDDEAWVYADTEDEDGGGDEEDKSGPMRKKVKTTHIQTKSKKVKWDRGVVIIRDFGEGLGKVKLASSASGSSTDSQREGPKSALSVSRQVALDQYGNILPTPSKKGFTVKPQKVVVQAIFYQGEEPYVAPAASTRGKKKAAA